MVAEVADGVAALSVARRLRPDVSLLDIRMPRMDGLEVTRRLAGPGVSDPLRVVVVTTFEIDDYISDALRSGACGYLLKGSGPALLVEAVRAAANGDALLSPSVTVRLLADMQWATAISTAPSDTLTERECDVVRLVARGRTNAEAAEELYVAASTIKTHLANVQSKLGVRNRVEIAAWAWETGLMAADRPTSGSDVSE